MTQIIDRRLNGKNKSAVNRQRFLRRFREQIRKSVSDAISQRSIRDIDKGETVNIPTRDTNEPIFHHGPGGRREAVQPGNTDFVTGDKIPRPPSGGGSGPGDGKASNSGEGYHLYLFFESPIPAVKCRALLIGILVRAGIDIGHRKDKQGSFDCIFPKQDSLDGLSLGNLIALPWSGIAFKNRRSTLYLNPNSFEAYGKSLEENIEFFLDDFETLSEELVDGLLGEMDITIDLKNNSKTAASQSSSKKSSSIDPAQILLGVPEGERDDKIFRYACSLRARSLSKEETMVLAKIAADNCRPPFPHDEVEIKVESAWRYSEIDKVIDELNEKHACVMNGGSFVILNEILDPVFNKKDITLSTVTDFKNRYMNKKTKNPNTAMFGEKKYVSVAYIWLNSNKRRFYEGIVFEPGKKKSTGEKYYNLFYYLT